MPASLEEVAQQLPAPPAETLAELAAVRPDEPLEEAIAVSVGIQPLKQEAFTNWSPGQTWFAWCSTTGTTVTMNDVTWTNWNNSVQTTTGSLAYNYTSNTAYVYANSAWTAWNTPYQETEDARLAREERERQVMADWQAAHEVQEREREQAKARSLALLKSLLTPAQWESYDARGWFEVRGSSGRRWRIRKNGQSGNVDLMPEEGEQRDASYCAHPPGGLPNADAHAAQMLALVTDDEAFTRVANVHYRRAGLRAVPDPGERARAGRETRAQAAAA